MVVAKQIANFRSRANNIKFERSEKAIAYSQSPIANCRKQHSTPTQSLERSDKSSLPLTSRL